MNIKKFNIEIHQLLFGLLLSSGFPALINNSILFESLDPDLKFTLYIFSLFIREFFIFLLGLKIILILFNKIYSERIKYITLIAFLPLIPISIGILNNFNIVLFYTGIRFYILFSLPLLVLDGNLNLNFRKNIETNDFIFYFYLILNILSFTIGYADFTPIPGSAQIGETFLGKRYMFNTSAPVIAAQQFSIFLIYTNFRLVIARSNFERTKFFIISFILLLFTLYAGGRAGVVVAILTSISSLIIYFFPSIKYIFLTQKKIKNKLFIFVISFLFSLILFILSSSSIISGRKQTARDINNKGIISGIYGSRLVIINKFFKERKIEDIIIGKPGRGTNTACNQITSDPFNEEVCLKTDSLPTSSIFSFGVIGILLYVVILIAVSYSSYSPLMPVAFLVLSLSQIFPELILPWTQFVLILFHSNQLGKNTNKKTLNYE